MEIDLRTHKIVQKSIKKLSILTFKLIIYNCHRSPTSNCSLE